LERAPIITCRGPGICARKVVLASSGAVYGRSRKVPITEDHPTDPITSYSIVRLAVQKYLGLFEHLHGLDYAALRMSNPYGSSRTPTGSRGAVPVWGDGSVVRDYLSDLVEALKLSAGTETPRKTHNVGRGRGTSLEELVAIIAEVTVEQPGVEYAPGRAREEELLGWDATTDLAEGVERIWNWVGALDERNVEARRV
jgi:UDP-glucose 4-epimerase